MGQRKTFEFESLNAFQESLKVAELVEPLVGALPPGRAYLSDQMRRAASSIVLNIAEGAGETSKPDKGRFYRYAKRSAVEVAGGTVLLETLKLVSPDKTLSLRLVLLDVIPMILGLMRYCGMSDLDEPTPSPVPLP